MDGKPDFESYTFEELLDAKKRVNREQHPENYETIISLLSNPDFVEKQKEIDEQRKAELKYSTLGPRVLASIIDGWLLIMVIYVESVLLGFEYSTSDNFLRSVNAVQFSLYVILMHGFFGQTVGKIIVGVKVLNYENELPIKLMQSLRRESVALMLNVIWMALPIISVFAFAQQGVISSSWVTTTVVFSSLWLIWGISNFITMLLSKKHRAIHDFIGKTIVVRV